MRETINELMFINLLKQRFEIRSREKSIVKDFIYH